ncbi:MAG: hypothetical protein AAFV45_09485 [Pseudomonadota bacterium]
MLVKSFSGLRFLAAASGCVAVVFSIGQAHAAAGLGDPERGAGFGVTAEARASEIMQLRVADWNEKKIRGIVKQYTGGSTSKDKKKKDCKTITHTNAQVQKRLRQACRYQK